MIPVEINAYIEIHDKGDGDDEYFFHGSTVIITDDGGDDSYTETPLTDAARGDAPRRDPGPDGASSPPFVETNAYIDITDLDGDDIYHLVGSTVIVTDDGGGTD